MSKEDFLQWAMAVVMQNGDGKDQSENEALAARVEQADKKAAALLRKVNAAAAELLGHLASVVSAEGK